ncbi:sorbitol/mannitol transport system permease protein [Saccharopolyspora antimicrobica]|uniref:Carbohydrate ABC transporter membrane protein 1 (CUT1 family) n=1 Tax=Saccharopolyspora antimicrobica TaxID=455193 RepID=A0A1I5FMN4_9PSEU|nr:sugar ABC transporter permease [Saccharopolyspora antimicrobica]RKT82235.1 carbohydrate ABC transporter membrane protein 1 (CUT1 family) [Saccharopolyspora antimicrobica]SFO25024.1 sorbitol/mannitol transport system permease protein [Saccharopolyspora antimicrobica]
MTQTATKPTAAPPVATRKPIGKWSREAWLRRAPLMPALLFTILVTQIPFLLTVFYSFQSWNLVRPGSRHFVGLRNYIDVFADSQFRGAMFNTVLLTVVCVLVAMLLGLGLALLLDRQFLGRGVVRTLLITPFLILPAAGALLWKTTMFDPTYGLLNFAFGTKIDWLSQFPLASVMAQVVWQWTPFMMLLILAGLQAQSKEVLEAAAVDGAGRWRTFASITLPQLGRYLQLAVLLGAIYIVNSFDAIYLMTQGGPGTASTNLPFYIYQRAFEGFDVGQSSAMGVIVVVLTLIVATFALRLMFRTFGVSEVR